MPIVNGHPADTGCYVEGHWGQYGPDHLYEQALTFGYSSEGYVGGNPIVWREIAEDGVNPLGISVEDAWDLLEQSADDIEQWLNSHTEDGFVWHWDGGEFFLSPLCENGECEDETCAHWLPGFGPREEE